MITTTTTLSYLAFDVFNKH